MSFLDKANTVAPADFNRWLVPPAALAVHLSIGQIYAYSVFNAPLTKVLGITESAPGDWSLATVGWIFSIALAVLGASAAMFGRWMERVGPRKAMFVAAVCFGLGFLISALGVQQHNLWLLYLGNGVLGGVGLGLGYIGPVSTLMKWFPDKPGMATGLAIMGFGGGAMLASPLSVVLMDFFKSPASVGVAETFVVLGIFYFFFMLFGVLTIRIPAEGWKPAGFVPKAGGKLVSDKHVTASQAVKTPQFYLLFWILCLNVTAGIGVLGQASVMIQELFSEQSVGAGAAVGAAAAAGFVGLLSLFNMGGRFSGPASPTGWGANRPTTFSSSSVRCSISPSPRWAKAAVKRCSSSGSASSSPCTAEGLPPCRYISKTCSARWKSAPSTAASSWPGLPPPCSAPCW